MGGESFPMFINPLKPGNCSENNFLYGSKYGAQTTDLPFLAVLKNATVL